MWEPRRQVEQPARRGSGERVDRLIVVADDADVVARAQPALEQRLLQEVHVLVLVDCEREVALAQVRRDVRVVVELPDCELQQVLEVDRALRGLAALVVAEDAAHEIRGDRRLVLDEGVEVRLRREAPVLRPLDLGGQIGRRPEAVRARQPVADRAEERRLRSEDSPRRLRRVPPQLSERGRMERRRAHALDPERAQARAHLAGRLVRERDCENLVGPEDTGRDLIRDPPRDRRRLAGARAREDADRAAHGLGRTPLLGIQALEDVHRTTLPTGPDGSCAETETSSEACPRARARARRRLRLRVAARPPPL